MREGRRGRGIGEWEIWKSNDVLERWDDFQRFGDLVDIDFRSSWGIRIQGSGKLADIPRFGMVPGNFFPGLDFSWSWSSVFGSVIGPSLSVPRLTLTLQPLLDQSKQQFPAKITECRCFVGVHVQRVRMDHQPFVLGTR